MTSIYFLNTSLSEIIIERFIISINQRRHRLKSRFEFLNPEPYQTFLCLLSYSEPNKNLLTPFLYPDSTPERFLDTNSVDNGIEMHLFSKLIRFFTRKSGRGCIYERRCRMYRPFLLSLYPENL